MSGVTTELVVKSKKISKTKGGHNPKAVKTKIGRNGYRLRKKTKFKPSSGQKPTTKQKPTTEVKSDLTAVPTMPVPPQTGMYPNSPMGYGENRNNWFYAGPMQYPWPGHPQGMPMFPPMGIPGFPVGHFGCCCSHAGHANGTVQQMGNTCQNQNVPFFGYQMPVKPQTENPTDNSGTPQPHQDNVVQNVVQNGIQNGTKWQSRAKSQSTVNRKRTRQEIGSSEVSPSVRPVKKLCKSDGEKSFTQKRTENRLSRKEAEVEVKSLIGNEGDFPQGKEFFNTIPSSKDKISKEVKTIEKNDKPKVLTESEKNYIESVNKHRKLIKKLPRVKLLEPGFKADLRYTDKDHRKVLLFSDLQTYMLHSQLEQMAPGHSLRWLQLKKGADIPKKIFLIVEGLSMKDYLFSESKLKILPYFNVKVEVLTPFSYGGDIVQEIVSVPLSGEQKRKYEKRFGSLNLAAQNGGGRVFRSLKKIFPVSDLPSQYERPKSEVPGTDKFSRVDLLLSPLQMLRENFPIPLKGSYGNKYHDFVQTRDEYAKVTPSSPMWAVDCEMCQTRYGNELTRVSIVNEKHEVVYETLVKPYNRIINYLTRYSGITASMLTNVWTRLEDVQADVRKICPPDLILIGHSLSGDLKAMKMMHPYVIDTSVIFNMSGERVRKSKLKLLAEEYLSERIQCAGALGHDSIEDSLTALKLVQLKLQHSLEWGDAVLQGPRDRSESEAARALLLQRDAEPPEPYQRTYASVYSESQKGKPPAEEKSLKEPGTVKPLSNPDFFTCLFTSLVKYTKTVALVGKKGVLCEYVRQMPAELKAGEPDSRVTLLPKLTNKSIVKAACSEAPVDFALAHIKFCPAKAQSSILRLDKWVNGLMEKCEAYTLITVILAGSEGVRDHGLCLSRVNGLPLSPQADKPASTPIAKVQTE